MMAFRGPVLALGCHRSHAMARRTGKSLAPSPLGRGIQLQVPLGQHGRAGPVTPAGPGAQPGRQFQQAERLDQVVVGARVQAADPVAERVARGEHDYRRPIVATDMGVQPFGYIMSVVVTIGLWLTMAPAIGAIARARKKD